MSTLEKNQVRTELRDSPPIANAVENILPTTPQEGVNFNKEPILDEVPPTIPSNRPIGDFIPNQQPSFYNNNNSNNINGNMNPPYLGGVNTFNTNSYAYTGNPYGSFFNNPVSSNVGYYNNTTTNNRTGTIQNFNESTQSTFELIESIIGAVMGFAQMLESTYVATHNSFFTMISVAEQFSYLKEMLGSFFGIFTVIKILRKILYTITNGKLGTDSSSLTMNKFLKDFSKFDKVENGSYDYTYISKRKKISLKPLLFFLASVFGFPFLLDKLIKKLEANKKLVNSNKEAIDPKNLQFGRALYDFIPENPNIEATMKKGELLAILNKDDTTQENFGWWKIRTKNGSTGYAPYNYIEIIQKAVSPTTNDV